MDLTRPIVYRAVNFNDGATTVDGIEGTIVQRVRYGGVNGVGYTEKKATGDGRNASDVYQDWRTVQIDAVTHALSRGDLYDRLAGIIAALTPRGAYVESPGDKGFLPLQFMWPTDRIEDFGSEINLFIKARPRAQPDFVIDRDSAGGDDNDSLAINWQVIFDAIDPRIYVLPRNDTDLTTATSPVALGNRGLYPAPLNALLVVPGGSGVTTFTLTGAGSNMTLVIPNDAQDRYVRVSSIDEVVTSQIGENGQETLAMSLLTAITNRQWPYVQPGGAETVAFTCDKTLGAGSVLFYYEAFA